ncbi:MAG: 4'-phosphopantetheinyl transferase superfamily protein [Puia sp.]|nr:4'-phosphopantetheinyl transferase superfamily protein [Puia sp.]
MKEKIREIVAAFTKIPAESIGPDTLIDQSVLKNSILLHRMYAKLAGEGVIVEKYREIRTAGDLFRAAEVKGDAVDALMRRGIEPLPETTALPASGQAAAGQSRAGMRPDWLSGDSSFPGIGIDMEEIASLPVAEDFREDPFYTLNFTAQEIAYCILRPDPYASFAGLFAAKEAIVKASALYRERPFNAIPISHSPEGKPAHEGFRLSISHTQQMAVAIAIPVDAASSVPASSFPPDLQQSNGRGGAPSFWILVLSLFLSVLAIVLILMH